MIMRDKVVFSQAENRTGILLKSSPAALCHEHWGLENIKLEDLSTIKTYLPAEIVFLILWGYKKSWSQGYSFMAAVSGDAPGSWHLVGDNPETCAFSYLYMNAVVLPKLTLKYSTNSIESSVNTLYEQYTVLAFCEGDAISGVVLLSGFRNMSVWGSVTVTLGIKEMLLSLEFLRCEWLSSLSKMTIDRSTHM